MDAGSSNHCTMRPSARRLIPLAATVVLLATAPMAVAAGGASTPPAGVSQATGAKVLFPPLHDGQTYADLKIGNGDCVPTRSPELPPSFDCKGSTKLTDYAPQPGDSDYDPTVENNPQELFGVKGAGTNHAWTVSTGRPDTVIAVLDSGIEWDTRELADKVELNKGELPPPCDSTDPSSCDSTYGDPNATWDLNGDHVFSVSDYANDPRVRAVTDSTGRGYVVPEDLIRAFSDGQDHDGNGYPNDIAGWDFYQHDNDPADDVTYGHGTGEAKDSSAQVTRSSVSQCPNCRVLPLRVGDSFIADINKFAAAVVYATDNHADVVQEALGTLNHTSFAQQAVDYAYAHGVLVVASEADEAAGHHNYPAALNHTMVVNSVTHYVDPVQQPKTYLAINGCTNYGGYTWVSVESNSCSSDATGQSAGMAGLLYSAAQNAVESGALPARPDGLPLSAEQAKQLFRLAAEDIDFSTPKPPFGPPNNFATTLPDTVRYVTTAGWDQVTGWGRISADKLVDLVTDGKIPGEADITSPTGWSPLSTTGTVDVVGRVAGAPKAPDYTYDVEVAPGVQPPMASLPDTWTTVATGSGTEPRTGTLATLDLAQVRAMIDAAPPAYTPANDPTSPDLPEQDAFRVRVVVHVDGRPDAVEQRQYFSHADADLLARFPRNLDADMTGAAFADIDGDGTSEMIFGDGNGYVHAMKADGTEAKGWPVATERLTWLPTGGHNAYTTGAVSPDVHAPPLLGSPLVADLDGDGYPEVAVDDIEGTLHVYDHQGREVDGFPVHTNRAWSHDPGCQEPGQAPDCDHWVQHHVRDHVNTVDKAFAAMPSAGDLDPSYPGLELVAGAMDGHVYAWHADGTPVAGWPVLPRDPAKVANVDPQSHLVTFKSGANAEYGKQIITTPTLADINGDGALEVLVNVDEEYTETPNWSSRTPVADGLGYSGAVGSGNTRTYALWADGTKHAGNETIGNLGDNAYLPGWPVKIGMIETELLPDVGSGSDGSPVVAHAVAGSDTPQIATTSIGGPPYLLNADGTSVYGADPDGHYRTMSTVEGKSAATDYPSIASLGGGALGRLGGTGSPMSFAMGATGLKRLLDVVLPDQQLGAEDHVDAWDTTTGTFEPGFPARMNDLQFFNTPAIADIDGSGRPSVLQGSAVYDLRAYQLGGTSPNGWPKFTGGWVTQTPAVGDLLGDGGLEVTIPTREGTLFVWKTAGSVCGDLEWPKFQHDLHNSGNYDTDATPPGALRGVHFDGDTLHVTASGDNGYCPGTGKSYLLTAGGRRTVLDVAPAPAGTAQTIPLGDLLHGQQNATISEVDAAGNVSFPVDVVTGKPGRDRGKHLGDAGANDHGSSVQPGDGTVRAVAYGSGGGGGDFHARDVAAVAAPFELSLLALVAAAAVRRRRRGRRA